MSKDAEYKKLVSLVEEGFLGDRHALDQASHQFWAIRNELSTDDGLVLFGHRLVIPTAARPDVRQKLHATHQRLERTKLRARQLVYWPGINSDITNDCESCVACRAYSASLPRESMASDPSPKCSK